MIIELIKKLLTFVMDTIFSVVDLPVIPPQIGDAVNWFFDLLLQGMSIVNWLLPLDLIAPGIDLIVALFLLEHGYRLVLWVLQKIPMLGIK